MKIKEISQKLKELNLPENQKENLIDLIDLKTDDNMEKVLNHMDQSISRFEAAIGSFKAETNAAISSLKAETNANIGALKESNTFIKWIVTGVGAIALAILGKLFKLF